METKGQQHNIQQLKVDFSLTGESDYQQVQDRISQLCQGKLTAEMEALFSKLADPDSLVRIDRLEIDVGTVEEEELETAVLKGVLSFLETELVKVFSGRVTEIRYTTESLKKGESTDLISLLEYFLLMGTWPVWKAVEITGTPEAILLEILRKQPADLRALLLRLGRQDRVKRKLAYQFSFPTYVSLVRLMAPRRAEGLLVFLEAFRTLHNRQTASAIPMVDLDGRVREFVLENMLRDTQDVFVGKVFLGQFFDLLAQTYRVDRVVLIYRYRERVLQPELAALIDRKFVTALSELWAEQEEALEEGTSELPGGKRSASEVGDQTDELIQFLEEGEQEEVNAEKGEDEPAMEKEESDDGGESESEVAKSIKAESETGGDTEEESYSQKDLRVDQHSEIKGKEVAQEEEPVDAESASKLDRKESVESTQEKEQKLDLYEETLTEKIEAGENGSTEEATGLEEQLGQEPVEEKGGIGEEQNRIEPDEGKEIEGEREDAAEYDINKKEVDVEELAKANEKGGAEKTELEPNQEQREEPVSATHQEIGENEEEPKSAERRKESAQANEKADLQKTELETSQEGRKEQHEGTTQRKEAAREDKAGSTEGRVEHAAKTKENEQSVKPEAIKKAKEKEAERLESDQKERVASKDDPDTELVDESAKDREEKAQKLSVESPETVETKQADSETITEELNTEGLEEIGTEPKPGPKRDTKSELDEPRIQDKKLKKDADPGSDVPIEEQTSTSSENIDQEKTTQEESQSGFEASPSETPKEKESLIDQEKTSQEENESSSEASPSHILKKKESLTDQEKITAEINPSPSEDSVSDAPTGEQPAKSTDDSIGTEERETLGQDTNQKEQSDGKTITQKKGSEVEEVEHPGPHETTKPVPDEEPEKTKTASKQEKEPSKSEEEKDHKEKSAQPPETTLTDSAPDSPPFPTESPTPRSPQTRQMRDLEERLKNAPHTLMPDLVRLGMRASVRRKWQTDLPESLIWLILEKRLPWEYEQLKHQVTTLEKRLESASFIPWSPTEIHEQVLAGVLNYTFAESGRPFDPGTFVRLLAWKISRKVTQPEDNVRSLLQSTEEEIALAQGEAAEASPDFPAKAGLVLYLTAGELPPGETLANLRRSFLSTLSREPRTVTRFLVQLDDPPAIVRKLNLFLPSDALISLVNAFQPIDRRILEEFDRETRILGEQLGKRLERSRPFYRYFWETVLLVLITRKVPGSDARKLVQLGLQGASERIGMAYGDWLGYALFFAGQLDRPETKLPLLKPVLREEFAQTHPVPQVAPQAQISDPDEPTLETLVEYLNTGKAAAVPSGSIQAYFGTLMEKWVHTETTLISRLLPILKEPSAKQRRLFDLLPEAIAPLFFTELSGMPGGFGKDVVQVLDWFAIALKPMPLWRLVIEQTLEVQPFHPKGFLRLVLRHSTAVVGIEYVELLQRVRTLSRAMGGYFTYSGSLPLMIEAIESEEIEFGFVTKSTELPPISKQRKEGQVPAQKQPAAEPEKRKYPKIWDKAPDNFSGQYRVHNAGIVLISSFIGRYFEVLGLVDDDGFTNDDAQYRSVLLLYYLATGKTTAKQEDLLLQRILCGLSPGATLKVLTLEPTEREEELTASLLKTVISYWTTLGETTVGTFRESFLTRSGELAKQQKGWRLRMDKEAFDLLMRTLPWSFSPINFSWMDTVIEVEWEEGM